MQKSEKKKQQIIKAAIKLFVEKGIHATPVSLLAKESNVAVGSIYTYFKSKEELVNVIFNDILNEEISSMSDGYDKSESVYNRFSHIITKLINFMIDNPEKFKFMHFYAFSPVILDEISSENCSKNHPLEDILNLGKAEKIIKDFNNEDLFFQIYGGVSAVFSWKLFNKIAVNDKEIKNLIDMSWDAITI